MRKAVLLLGSSPLLLGALLSGCSVLTDGDLSHRFNKGFGYVVFQNGDLGAAGGSYAAKLDRASNLAIDQHSRYVVSGSSKSSAGGRELVVWRYKSNGQLDTSFGNGVTAGLGYVRFLPDQGGAGGTTAAARSDTMAPSSLVVDSLNRYILTGRQRTSAGGSELILLRYLEDGQLDPDFGAGSTLTKGYAIFNSGGLGAANASSLANRSDSPWGLSQDSQGRYIVFGQSTDNNNRYVITIWRFLSSGALDTTFGSGSTAGAGYVLYQQGGAGLAGAAAGSKRDYVWSGFVDTQGRYVACGSSLAANLTTSEAYLVRYLSTGALDTSFGSQGVVVFNQGAAGVSGFSYAVKSEYCNQVKEDSRGRYYLVGPSEDSSYTAGYLFIARYLDTGALDTSYGTGATTGRGHVVFNIGQPSAAGAASNRFDTPTQFAIDSQDKLIVTGQSTDTAGAYLLPLWRYNTDGSLDTGFGSGAGYTVFQKTGTSAAGGTGASKLDYGLGIAIDRAGRFVVTGGSKAANNSSQEIVIWRYLSTGELDR